MKCKGTVLGFFSGATAQLGPRPPHCWDSLIGHTHTYTRTHVHTYRVNSSEWVISSPQRRLPRQHKQIQLTNIRALSGIRKPIPAISQPYTARPSALAHCVYGWQVKCEVEKNMNTNIAHLLDCIGFVSRKWTGFRRSIWWNTTQSTHLQMNHKHKRRKQIEGCNRNEHTNCQTSWVFSVLEAEIGR